MVITPTELVPITAACTLVTTLVAMTVQRAFSRRDADREARRRNLETRESEFRALRSIPLEQAIRRQERARLELLRLFTDVQSDIDVTAIQARLDGRQCPKGMTFRNFLRATHTRQDDHLQRLARPWFEQLTNDVERELLAACADIVTHWDEFDNFHNFGWSSQVNIARTCAHYATRVIGAALRCEPLPLPIYSVLCRLPERPGAPALRKSRNLTITYLMMLALGVTQHEDGRLMPTLGEMETCAFFEAPSISAPPPQIKWLEAA